MKRSLCLAALSLVVAMLIVGSVAGAQRQATKTVSIQDYRFLPAKITVKPGTKVAWVNRGDAPHTATANNGAFNSGTLQPGERFSRTFRKAGKFAYHCEIHPQMKGSVTVMRQR